MVVLNSQRTPAVVIRHDGKNVRLVAMRPGRLGVSRLPREAFEAEWQSHAGSLSRTLADFLLHAERHGATAEALKGLESLVQRDRYVVDTLF